MDEKPGACFNCCSTGGGWYKPYEGETTWWIGLTADGQAHYACDDCAPLLFNAIKLNCAQSTSA